MGASGGTVSSDGGSGVGAASSGGATMTGGAPAVGGTLATGGGADRDSFFGDSRCQARSFLLCDGFEATSIDSALWAIERTETNVVELSQETAARGAQSVHIKAENGFGYLKNTSVFPIPSNNYFGRMFLRVKRFSEVSYAHWTVAEAAGNGDGSVIRVGGQYADHFGANRYGVGSDGGPTGDWTLHDADPAGKPEEPPANAWVCLEWEHRGSENSTRFFVDGIEHPSLATSETQHGGEDPRVKYVLPEVTSLWFGWWQYQSDSEPFDVWIDELVIDTARIGCED